jgi:hypothetical protein
MAGKEPSPALVMGKYGINKFLGMAIGKQRKTPLEAWRAARGLPSRRPAALGTTKPGLPSATGLANPRLLIDKPPGRRVDGRTRPRRIFITA